MNSVKLDRVLRISILGLLGILVFVIYTTISERVVSVGDTAPNFSIQTDNGRTVSTSNFGGKLLVLNFWATWCPPCVSETPSLNRFSQIVANQGVVVLGVSVDKDPKAYKSFLQQAGVTYLTARDPEMKINSDYGTFKYPETYVINAQGKVVRKYIGERPWDDERMLSDIRSLL